MSEVEVLAGMHDWGGSGCMPKADLTVDGVCETRIETSRAAKMRAPEVLACIAKVPDGVRERAVY